MLGIQDLQDRLGLSEWQARRLIDAVRPVLESRDLLQVANGRKIQVSPQSIPLLERATELHRGGVVREDLAEVLQDELAGSDGSAADKGKPELQSSAEPLQIVVEELRFQLAESRQREAHFRQREERLLEMLEDRDGQIKALMPGRSADAGNAPVSDGGGQRMGRLRALRYAILGR